MLLRNYDNIMTAKRLTIYGKDTTISTDTKVFGDGHINVKQDYNGSIKDIYISTKWSILPLSSFAEYANDYNTGMEFGVSNLVCGGGNTDVNGNVGVNYDDYDLAETFTSSQVGLVPSSSKEEKVYNNDGSWTSTYSRMMVNLTDDVLTVKEIGVVCGFYYSSSGRSNCLVYRKVLDTPIEVPAGANFILSFTTTVSANPNKPADYEATASVVE